jgi:predicted nucleic acid-binding protein
VKRYVLDSWAFLAWLQDEPVAASRVESLLEEAERQECALFASLINIGEVYYLLAKRVGEDRAMQFRNLVFGMPVTIISATDDQVWQAVNFKKAFAISYADAFAASAALTHDAAIATGDPEFLEIGPSGPPVFWLGDNGTDEESRSEGSTSNQ